MKRGFPEICFEKIGKQRDNYMLFLFLTRFAVPVNKADKNMYEDKMRSKK